MEYIKPLARQEAKHSRPHPSWGGWRNYLDSLDVVEVCDGVTHYADCNCNYILFPTGDLLENFGFHGRNVMRDVKEHGWKIVLERSIEGHLTLYETYDKLCASIDRLIHFLKAHEH